MSENPVCTIYGCGNTVKNYCTKCNKGVCSNHTITKGNKKYCTKCVVQRKEASPKHR